MPSAAQALLGAIQTRITHGVFPFAGYDIRYARGRDRQGRHHIALYLFPRPNCVRTADGQESPLTLYLPEFHIDVADLADLFDELETITYSHELGFVHPKLSRRCSPNLQVAGIIDGLHMTVRIYCGNLSLVPAGFFIDNDGTIYQLQDDLPTKGKESAEGLSKTSLRSRREFLAAMNLPDPESMLSWTVPEHMPESDLMHDDDDDEDDEDDPDFFDDEEEDE
jgi:hypothetical protein